MMTHWNKKNSEYNYQNTNDDSRWVMESEKRNKEWLMVRTNICARTSKVI